MGDGLPLGAHPMGDVLHLWEPTPWAMGVEHALSFALQTIAHRVGSYTNKHRRPPSPPALSPSTRPNLQPKHHTHRLAALV
jgi:hypothetical protein